jgi:hypothetical protein
MRFSVIKGIFWLMLMGAISLFVACGSDSSSSSGTLQVALTDAVDPNLKEVVISIKEIRVVPNGREAEDDGGLPLIKSFDPSLVVNVLDLAYQQEILGEAHVPTGSYNQVRLVLDANSVGEPLVNYITFQDDSVAALDADELALTTPSAQTSGLKILGKFTVLPGEITAIVLDFDPAKAVHESRVDKWMLKPTGIRIVEVDEVLIQYGALTGIVLSSDTVVADAIVSVVPEGQELPIAAGLVNPEDGSFRALLPEGSYFIRVDADVFEPYLSEPDFFDVAVGADTDAGVIELTSIEPL